MSQYSFSIIMPIHNAANHLEESIESVVDQTLDFDKHVQLVLVDDSSTDASASVCQTYADKYDNVLFEKQPCLGAGAALGKGVELAEGDYLGFLNAGDKWDESALEAILEFFQANPATGIASARTVYLGAEDASAAPEGEFETTRIVNVFAEPTAPQVSGDAIFFKSDTIKNLTLPATDTDVPFYVASKAIMKAGVFGLVAEAIYYRRSSDGVESRAGAFASDGFDEGALALFRSSKDAYGHVIPYVQHTVVRSLGDSALQIDALRVDQHAVVVEGSVNAPLDLGNASLQVKAGKKAIEGELFYLHDSAESGSFESALSSQVGFKFNLPRDYGYLFFFELECGNKKRKVGYELSQACRLTKMPGSYFIENNVAVVARASNRIQVIPNPTLKERIKRMLSYYKAKLRS